MSRIVDGTSSPQNVAVLVFPFTSHPASLLRFIRSISTLATHMQFTFFNISRSNSSLFSGSSSIKGFDNIKPYDVCDGLPEGYIAPSGNLLDQVELFLDTGLGNFEKAIKEAEAETGKKFDLLIADAFLWFASDIAEKMHVTWVPFWISGQRSLPVHIETDIIREKLGAQGQEDKTLDFLPGFSNEFLASDIPKEIAFGDIEPPLARMLHKMGQKLPQATVVVINSFETIDLKVTEELKKRLQKLLLVGPQHLVRRVQSDDDDDEKDEEDDGCFQWLDKQEPASVAYISFGSVGALPPMEVAALAEALEERRFPFLWSFRGNQEDFPQGFIGRTNRLSIGKVVPWVNQEKILSHSSVGVHVTHCGWNSVLESITGGVPMTGRPYFADQNFYMRSVEVVWRIGVRIEGGFFTKTRAVEALEQALRLEQGREMRQRVGILKQLAQEAVGLNGRSAQDLKALVEIIRS
ncbi:PREDICTED: kaempferol 3-O-beta-D-galactosyltransferase-like [Fragaria vesca subsp. vesca]|uniref:kaempferol 3-O-beta-D-galactosyltransferase-like n=1 Tax=Fragaria vesca subsp. vesca TaxID=101020 RepID=UPI0002C37409|nr:PREDICTED: kaempferol 3-O-beta-D-galactosyltransferase-like [Fragaria vesca subsp. vesca]